MPEYNSMFFSVKEECTSKQMEEIGKHVLKMDGALSVSYTHDIEKQLDDMLRSLAYDYTLIRENIGFLTFSVVEINKLGNLLCIFKYTAICRALLLSIYRELEAQPAVLMRPPAPKNGRRGSDGGSLLFYHTCHTGKAD